VENSRSHLEEVNLATVFSDATQSLSGRTEGKKGVKWIRAKAKDLFVESTKSKKVATAIEALKKFDTQKPV
jgi:hypothetical protein